MLMLRTLYWSEAGMHKTHEKWQTNVIFMECLDHLHPLQPHRALRCYVSRWRERRRFWNHQLHGTTENPLKWLLPPTLPQAMVSCETAEQAQTRKKIWFQQNNHNVQGHCLYQHKNRIILSLSNCCGCKLT